MLSVLCRDMVVFCRDRNFLLQLFNFVATVSAMLQHSFFVILNLCHDMLFFVTTEFLPITWICSRNILFICREKVVLPCIVETELCVVTDTFHVATESSLLLVIGLNFCMQH